MEKTYDELDKYIISSLELDHYTRPSITFLRNSIELMYECEIDGVIISSSDCNRSRIDEMRIMKYADKANVKCYKSGNRISENLMDHPLNSVQASILSSIIFRDMQEPIITAVIVNGETYHNYKGFINDVEKRQEKAGYTMSEYQEMIKESEENEKQLQQDQEKATEVQSEPEEIEEITEGLVEEFENENNEELSGETAENESLDEGYIDDDWLDL